MAVVAALTLTHVACSSFGSDGGGAPPDGTATDSGGVDAIAADAADGSVAVGDSSASVDADDAAASCTALDSLVISGWAPSMMGGASLTAATRVGRQAVVATVQSSFDRATFSRNVQPTASGRLEVDVDFLVSSESSTVVGWIAELVTLSCTAPAQRLSLLVSPGGDLSVEGVVGGATAAVKLGTPASTWKTLTLDVDQDLVTVRLDGITRGAVKMQSSFAPGVGCTLTVGATPTGNVPVTSGAYSRVCLR